MPTDFSLSPYIRASHFLCHAAIHIFLRTALWFPKEQGGVLLGSLRRSIVWCHAVKADRFLFLQYRGGKET